MTGDSPDALLFGVTKIAKPIHYLRHTAVAIFVQGLDPFDDGGTKVEDT